MKRHLKSRVLFIHCHVKLTSTYHPVLTRLGLIQHLVISSYRYFKSTCISENSYTASITLALRKAFIGECLAASFQVKLGTVVNQISLFTIKNNQPDSSLILKTSSNFKEFVIVIMSHRAMNNHLV